MRFYLIIVFVIYIMGCNQRPDNSEDLALVKRAEWGSIHQDHDTAEHTIKYITIHHGGVVFTGDKSTKQYLVDLQSWSRSEKKWIDIPYHYVMDLGGDIYEARPDNYPGDTNTEYDPTGHLLICVLGNYEEQEMNPQQYHGLVNFLVHFSKKYNVPIELIKSHKDYTETACPGKNIYKYLKDGSLLAEVQKQK